MKLLISLYLLLISTFSYGNCVCRCVNGEMTPICSSSIDLPPICPPTVCPIVPPSVQPINPPVVPPIGTSQCQNKQVLNQRTGQYEWRLICQ
jgi:hypothetical protein